MKGLFVVLALTAGVIAAFLLASALHPDSGRSPKKSSPYLHDSRNFSFDSLVSIKL